MRHELLHGQVGGTATTTILAELVWCMSLLMPYYDVLTFEGVDNGSVCELLQQMHSLGCTQSVGKGADGDKDSDARLHTANISSLVNTPHHEVHCGQGCCTWEQPQAVATITVLLILHSQIQQQQQLS